MPYKPKRPCSYPGCPRLTDGRYCEEHARLMAKEYEKHGRNKDTRKRYGKHWKRIRDAYVAEHPWCELCLREGQHVPAEEVHHIRPLAEGGSNEWSNLMALCKHCHASLHARRGDRWNNRDI